MFLSTYWTRVQSFLPCQLENAKNQRNDSNACTLPKLTNRRLVSLSFYIEPECVVTRTTRLTSQREQEGNLAKSLFVIFTKFSFGWKKNRCCGGGLSIPSTLFYLSPKIMNLWTMKNVLCFFWCRSQSRFMTTLTLTYEWLIEFVLSLLWVYYKFIISTPIPMSGPIIPLAI